MQGYYDGYFRAHGKTVLKEHYEKLEIKLETGGRDYLDCVEDGCHHASRQDKSLTELRSGSRSARFYQAYSRPAISRWLLMRRPTRTKYGRSYKRSRPERVA